MARPRMTIGATGNIRTTGQVQDPSGRWVSAPSGAKPTRYKARCSVRDQDGRRRDVTRFAKTKSRATADLQKALAERVAPVGVGLLRGDTTLSEAAQLWLRQVERPDSALSDNTRDHYKYSYARYVAGSAIAGLTLVEANRVQVLERWLQDVADHHGTGAAKTARSVVSNVLSLGVRYGALSVNAMREVRPARASSVATTVRDTRRAFTMDERERVLEVARINERAQAQDVVDIVHYLAGTGVRISEALGQRWSDVDLGSGTVHVRGTKTSGSDRVLALPQWLCERLQQRAALADRSDGLVFPSPGTDDRNKVRDLRNVQRIIRQILDEAACEWATPHTFRRTVATMLDAAGLPIALAAKQLGHKDAGMTMRVYLGRTADMSAAAAAL